MSSHKPHYFLSEWIEKSDQTLDADICVYGGTAAGVVASVTAAARGKSVILLNPGVKLGGMTTGGLGWTDFGRKHAIGGRAHQFYRDVGREYGKDEEWQFAPSAAQAVIDRMIADAGVPVYHRAFIDAAFMSGRRIQRITMLGGMTLRARVFIDATYEGDLMARAGVSYTIGRESNAVYDELLNGIQVRNKHQFSHPVDPFVREGEPGSGLLPFIDDEDRTTMQGSGDRRVQAYCFRVCMTDDPALKIDWQRPEPFDSIQYELARRWFNSEKDAVNDQLVNSNTGDPRTIPQKFDILANKTPDGYHKTDTNNNGPVSSDFIGSNYAWPEADYSTRERIFQAHVAYQQGLYWFIANDPSIPQRYRDAYGRWGLPRDEFVDSGHWPHQLYVREARRMVSDYVVTEHDCRGRHVEDSIAMGSYTMDSHNCSRFVTTDAGRPRVLNEGDVQVPPTDPYPLSYRAIVPQDGECENLLVPICFSASHIAYGSARMEPVFMAIGQSAAIAACQAIDNDQPLQGMPYAPLRKVLEEAGQVLFL